MSDVANGVSRLANDSVYQWKVKVQVVGIICGAQGSGVEHIEWYCVATLRSLRLISDSPHLEAYLPVGPPKKNGKL